ncbi:MAG: hypothetical protein KA436_07550 [Oligoflexales bacterium]|nr:hypothetical protein [Oligoflexales bacterium]
MTTNPRILTLSRRVIILLAFGPLSFSMKITGQGIGETACPPSAMELLTYDPLVSFEIFRAMQPLIATVILFRTDSNSNSVCRFGGNEAPNLIEVHATLKQVILELSRPKEKDYIIFHDVLMDVPYLVVRGPSGNIVGVHRRLSGRYAQEYYKKNGLPWVDTEKPTVFEFRSVQLITNVEASTPLVDALRARVSGNDRPTEVPAPELLWHLIYHLERVRVKLSGSGQYDHYLSRLKGSPPNYREYMQLVFELLKYGTDLSEADISRNSQALPRLLEHFPRQVLWPSYKARISPQRFLKALLYGLLPIALETERTTLHDSPKKVDSIAVAMHDLVHYGRMMDEEGFRVLEIVKRICSSAGTEGCLGELDPDFVAPAYWVIHEKPMGLNFGPLGVSFDQQFLPKSLDNWNQVRKPSPHMPSPAEMDEFKKNLSRLLVIINLAEQKRLAKDAQEKAEDKARERAEQQIQYFTQHFGGVLYNPPSDGFCFWHILAHALNNGQSAQNLQQQVLAFLSSIAEALDGGGVLTLTGVQQQFLLSTGLDGPGLLALILAQDIGEEDFEQRRSLRTLPWATDQMIQAAALLFGVIINVTGFPNPDTNQPVQQAFQPYEPSESVQSIYVGNLASGTHFVQTGPHFSPMSLPQTLSLLWRIFIPIVTIGCGHGGSIE